MPPTRGITKAKPSLGFTLIELIVVIAIIAILAAILAPTIQNSIRDTQVAGTVNDLKSIKDALNRYYIDVGSYPPSVLDLGRPWGSDVGLVAKANAHTNHQPKWKGPYLESWPKKTPMGTANTAGAYHIYEPTNWIDLDGIASNDVWIHIDANATYNDYKHDYINEAIDKALDDGDGTTGLIRLTDNNRKLFFYAGEGNRNW